MEMETETLQEEERKEVQKKRWKKRLGWVLLAGFLLYCVYLAVPRHLTTVIPDVYQAECIEVLHHGMEESYTLTVRGNEMRQLIDHLDRFTFQPLGPFNVDRNIYYGEAYHIYIIMGNGRQWGLPISDQGDVGIDNIFGTDWLREGRYQIGQKQIQVLPPELEAQMERHEIS